MSRDAVPDYSVSPGGIVFALFLGAALVWLFFL